MFMLPFIFVIACGLFELKRIHTEMLSFVYICIAFGDLIINSSTDEVVRWYWWNCWSSLF